MFSKFSKLPSSLRDSGNFVKTLKILVKLILNCPRAHAITYTNPRAATSLPKVTLRSHKKMLRERKGVATETLGDLAGRKAATARTANRAHPPTVLTVQSITLYVSYQISPKRQSVGSAVQSFHVARRYICYWPAGRSV